MAKAPAFQHRHYAAIAGRIRAEMLKESDSGCRVLADFAAALAKDFAADNPNFDAERFRDAWNGDPTRKDERTAARLVRA